VPVEFRLSSLKFSMLNIRISLDSVLLSTARSASQEHNTVTTPQPFLNLKYKPSAYWPMCHGIDGSQEDSTGGRRSLESLRCNIRHPLIFSTTEIWTCHLRDTIFNSSDVLAVLKLDMQLSAPTSPSAFNQGQNNTMMGETGTHKAVLREASPHVRIFDFTRSQKRI
jgi:hypothetical protein